MALTEGKKTCVIFDIEWNQANVPKKRIKDLIGEIIQIGAVKTDFDLREMGNFDEMIKPVFYPKMNKEIQELTLITDKDLESGKPFAEVIRQFVEFCGEDSVLISWSATDVSVLRNNLRKFEIDESWIPLTYDAQLMFDDQEMQENRQWPLNYALYHYNEKPDGAHNALADVYSTIAILRHLDLKEALEDEYFLCEALVEEDEEGEDGEDGEE